jgi:quercetin dioxygenase-like cupin family protein
MPSGERRPIEAVAVTLATRGASGKHPARLPADQFAYVLQGPLRLFLGDDDLTLATGDAVVIPRRTPHRWQNDGPAAAQMLLVSLRFSH